MTLLVSHSCYCELVDVDHNYNFDMFAARNFLLTEQTEQVKEQNFLCRSKPGNTVKEWKQE